MKFGIRKPSLKKSLAARMSVKKKLAPRMPRGLGILRDPQKAIYNKVYNVTTVSAADLVKPRKSKTSETGGKEASKGSAAMGFIILAVMLTIIVILIKLAC